MLQNTLHENLTRKKNFVKFIPLTGEVKSSLYKSPTFVQKEKKEVMIFIHRPQTDPFFNLAAEEYLLRHREEDLLMLWRSEPSVVVGKHQNLMAEVDMDFVRRENIPVIRRISGGGTVFHDLGNVNVTLISTVASRENIVDFYQFTRPVIDFLQLYGVEAAFTGKNNLVARGKKFSGNAAHVFKNRIVYHGTLLYHTDLDKLEKVILSHNDHITDKAVKSVRAAVGNLSDWIENPPETAVFMQQLEQFLKKEYAVSQTSALSLAEEQVIEKLAEEKYRSWEWNAGYSPSYTIQQQRDTAYGLFQVTLQVKEGKISDVRLIFEGKRLEKIEQQLIGKKHDKAALQAALAENRFSEVLVQTMF
jgi:lipoate-protein ligase A